MFHSVDSYPLSVAAKQGTPKPAGKGQVHSSSGLIHCDGFWWAVSCICDQLAGWLVAGWSRVASPILWRSSSLCWYASVLHVASHLLEGGFTLLQVQYQGSKHSKRTVSTVQAFLKPLLVSYLYCPISQRKPQSDQIQGAGEQTSTGVRAVGGITLEGCSYREGKNLWPNLPSTTGWIIFYSFTLLSMDI